MRTQPKNPPGVNGFRYKEQYGIVVICDDENHQKATYEKLKPLGYKMKVVCV